MIKLRVLAIAVGLVLVGLMTVGVWLSLLHVHVPQRAYELAPAHESLEQTRAILNLVESQIIKLPPNEGRSDDMKMMEFSAAVYQRAIAHPELPDVWKAAALVINRRSMHDSNAIAAICGGDPGAKSWSTSGDKSQGAVSNAYQNCTISLDDDGRAIKQGNRRGRASAPKDYLLQLKNVRVMYSGGALLPISVLGCVECTFEVDLRGSPPPRGKSLIRGLLMAYSDNFAINISDD